MILGQKESHTLLFFGPFLGIFGPLLDNFNKFDDKNSSYEFLKLVHQSKILYIVNNTYVGDDKMILGQKDSRTLPFFGPFLCIFGPFLANFDKFEDKNSSYEFLKQVHQSKILFIVSNTYVGDDKMVLGQKDSRTLPFFGPFLGLFGPF